MKNQNKELLQTILLLVALVIAFALFAHYDYKRHEVNDDFSKMLEKQYLLNEGAL